MLAAMLCRARRAGSARRAGPGWEILRCAQDDRVDAQDDRVDAQDDRVRLGMAGAVIARLAAREGVQGGTQDARQDWAASAAVGVITPRAAGGRMTGLTFQDIIMRLDAYW